MKLVVLELTIAIGLWMSYFEEYRIVQIGLYTTRKRMLRYLGAAFGWTIGTLGRWFCLIVEQVLQ